MRIRALAGICGFAALMACSSAENGPGAPGAETGAGTGAGGGAGAGDAGGAGSDSEQTGGTGGAGGGAAGSGGGGAEGEAPTGLRAVKWKQEMNGQDDAASHRFETRGLKKGEAVRGLADQGVKHVVLKVAELSILPEGTTVAQRDAEVIAMLGALSNAKRGFRAYLWNRQWMQRSGAPTDGAEEFAGEMSRLINAAKSKGFDDVLSGVIPIETNLETSAQTTERALKIARAINEKTGGWLKKKTLMMPGAGMGAYFKGIGQAGEPFFAKMSKETGRFAFIYKHMKSQGLEVCALAKHNDAWEAHLSPGASATVGERKTFLRDVMGLANLEKYVAAHRDAYPAHADVTFWGDAGDGVILMSSKSLRAVHDILVVDNGFRGYFFDLALVRSDTEGPDRKKSLLIVDAATKAVTPNLWPSHTGSMTVWDEWQRWPSDTPEY